MLADSARLLNDYQTIQSIWAQEGDQFRFC